MVGQSVGDGGRPQRRWTADTEVAFLLALRLTGTVAAACAAIGRSTGATARRRARLPEFEARCRLAIEEHRAAREPAPLNAADPGAMDNRVRIDGWTPVRQRAFLRWLSETGSYSAACRKVGLSRTSADRMRRTYPDFAAACAWALGRAPVALEQIAYERAVEGWDEPIVHAGKIVGHRRRYSEPLLRLLLQREAARNGLAPAGGAAGRSAGNAPAKTPRGLIRKPPMTSEEVTAALTRKLDALARRAAAQERERMIAWADDMARRGLAP